MDIQKRMNDMGNGPFLLAVAAAVLSIGGIVTSFGAAADGEVYGYTRIALGALGVAASAVMLFGKDFGRTGWMLMLAWAVIQSVFYADESGGNYTRQLVDAFAGISTSTTINGEVTNYSAIGANLVGLAMLFWTYVSRGRLDLWRRRAS